MELTWLDHPLCQQLSLAGAKGANLARLIRDYPVPPGFCLTTKAHQQWVDQVDEDVIAPELFDLIQTAYLDLAQQTQFESPSVAVRSSAVDEDGHYASFAGQYETFLNVKGIRAICQAVIQCWTSAQANRVQLYRNQNVPKNDNGETKNRLAVLIQWLVPADSAFVAFSQNPVSKRDHEIIINANFGLGESIVSGLTVPDTYLIDKSDFQVREQNIGRKELMTVAVGADAKTIKVPRVLRERAVLDDKKIIRIAQMAAGLEKQLDWPVDIEGAFHNDQLYLLQCRPISTTTNPIR